MITLCASSKLKSIYVEVTTLEQLTIFLNLYNFCVWNSRVAFFGALEPPFICQQENIKI